MRLSRIITECKILPAYVRHDERDGITRSSREPRSVTVIGFFLKLDVTLPGSTIKQQ